jgi:mRNA-degrading endonuclease RelE of RelBE toxin-antitoxin system
MTGQREGETMIDDSMLLDEALIELSTRADIVYSRFDTVLIQMAMIIGPACDDVPLMEQRRRPLVEPSTPSEWFLGLSDQFLKCIDRLDRKLQGRILAALADVSKDPLKVKGDTVKPLKHKTENLWRYRLGDFRLIYHVNTKKKLITLLTMEPRGSVYAD